MRYQVIFLILLTLSAVQLSGQSHLRATVTTNKAIYSYGETIGVTVEIWGVHGVGGIDTLWGSSNSLVKLRIDSVKFQDTSSKDSVRYLISKNTGIIWTWSLEPSLLGIPTFDGLHTVTAYVPGYPTVADTTSFSSPAFLGGILTVRIKASVPKEDVDRVRDSLHVTVLSVDTLQNQGLIVERWKVLGMQIDSLAVAYKRDNRFESLEPYRPMPLPQKVVNKVAYDSHPVESFQLYDNYPNPFNSTTTIRIKLPHASNGTLSIHDIQGRLIAIVFNVFLSPGTHTVRIDLGQVSSGVYFYRFKSRDFEGTKRMVLLR